MPGGYLYSCWQEYLDRSIAVEPDILLKSPVWEQLVAIRDSVASADLSAHRAKLRSLLLNDRRRVRPTRR
jgi:hypothetical protein